MDRDLGKDIQGAMVGTVKWSNADLGAMVVAVKWSNAESGTSGKSSCMIVFTAAKSKPSVSAKRTIFLRRGKVGGDLEVFSDVFLITVSILR